MRAVYKCRLCGAVYHNGAHAGKDIAIYCMAELAAGLVCTNPMAPAKTEMHQCGGPFEGSLGLADFQGWRAEEGDK